MEGVRWLLCDARNDRNGASVSFRCGCHGVLGDTPREQPSRRESTKIINAVRRQETSEEEMRTLAAAAVAPPRYPSKGAPVLGNGVSTGTLACQEGKLMPGNQENTKGDGLSNTTRMLRRYVHPSKILK